ncbi:50S ribosomal protein L34e [Candidatus Woesearchaeota archaeon]|nr:50S ribosomal protein L34e [Candidatus Woesearchaeota archaeon]
MVSGRHKSRTLRRVAKKTPGGRNVTHYEERKPAAARCAGCGTTLKGVPRERPFRMQTMPKSRKRPERPYGGVLCHACLKKKIVAEARR